MFPMRRAALRFLSTRSTPFATRSRTITSLSSPLRVQKPIVSLLAQRRWASDEIKPAEETPISQLQPTPQEEVENAIHEDNAAPVDAAVEGGAYAPVEDAGGAGSDGVSGERFERHRAEPKPTVYIGNLFFDVTEDDLNKEFSRFGNVKSVKIIRDGRGLSKGFGYITFDSVEPATSAIESLNLQLFEGRRLTVQYAATDAAPRVRTERNPRSSRSDFPRNPPSKTLFIGNMSWDMTDRDLNNLFRGIKNIIDVRVAVDRRTGQPRGFAHADFADVKSATEALQELSGKESYGRRLKLDYSYGQNASPKTQAKDQGEL